MVAVWTTQLGISRGVFSMARDSVFPRALCAVHPNYGTPHLSILAVNIGVMYFFRTHLHSYWTLMRRPFPAQRLPAHRPHADHLAGHRYACGDLPPHPEPLFANARGSSDRPRRHRDRCRLCGYATSAARRASGIPSSRGLEAMGDLTSARYRCARTCRRGAKVPRDEPDM